VRVAVEVARAYDLAGWPGAHDLEPPRLTDAARVEEGYGDLGSLELAPQHVGSGANRVSGFVRTSLFCV